MESNFPIFISTAVKTIERHQKIPMSWREVCCKCKADQHVCNMCLYYVSGRCEEEQAEHITDTERANFCDYFKHSNNVFKTIDKQESDKAKA